MIEEFLSKIINKAIELQASDIHISVNNKIAFRTNTGLEQIDDFGILGIKETKSLSESLFDKLLDSSKNYLKKELCEKYHTGFGFKYEKLKFRVNISTFLGGYYIVMRKNTAEPIPLDSLGFNSITLSALETVQKKHAGLFLVVGQTGSGKSTTLAGIIKAINEKQEKNIITLEDPIEYEHLSKKSIVVQKELGRDLVSFNEGLRSALREDPDIILVGEIRDMETLNLALKAAETGHLVLSTLHTDNSVSTLQRIIAMSPAGTEEFVRSRLSDSLIGVIAQKLIRTSDNKRTLIWDILMQNTATANNIKDNSINQIKASLDTIPMSQSYNKTLEQLYKNNKIDMKDALKYSSDKESLARALNS